MSLSHRALVILAIAGSGALLVPWQLAAMAMAIVLITAVIDAFLVSRVPTVIRSVPEVLSRGVPAPFEVEPMGRWPRIRLRQPLIPDVSIADREADRGISSMIVASRRGSHFLGPIATKTTGPLGLGVWYHRTGGDVRITVYPDMPAARRLATAVRTGLFREEGRRGRGPLGLGTEFESIREYRPDDDVRQINWKATARSSRPMSNQFRIEQDRDVICLIDCGRLMASRIGDRTRLDAAVDAAAAVAAVADVMGDRVGVVAFDSEIRRAMAPRRDGGGHVAVQIHDLEPRLVDSDFEQAFRSVLKRKRAFVLVLTDIIDLSAARPLVAAVPVLTRKHSLAVASIIDPDLDEVVSTRAPSKADVMRSAVAVKLLNDKEAVASELRHRGAQVLEGTSDLYSSLCVGAYLRAKRAARL